MGERVWVRGLACLILCLGIWGAAGPAQAVDVYELSGSDLGLGVGSRAVGMGGAFTALADGPEALYFNVAGLSRVPRHALAVMIDYPFYVSFAGAVLKTPWKLFDRPLTIGIGITSRLRVHMEGDFSRNDRARDITRLSLIYIPPDFNGGIDSFTYDYQAALALPLTDRLDVGISGSRVDCLSTYFGQASGRVCQHSAFWQATLGVLYRPADSWQIGSQLRNVSDASKPRYWKVGAAHWWADGFVSTLDVEYIFGKSLLSNDLLPTATPLPGSPVSVWLLRAGTEVVLDPHLVLRGGVLLAASLNAGGLGDLGQKLTVPRLGPTLGLSYRAERFAIDAALTPDLGRIYVLRRIEFNTSATVSLFL